MGAKQSHLPPPALPDSTAAPPLQGPDLPHARVGGPIIVLPPDYDWAHVDTIPGWFSGDEADWLASAVAGSGPGGFVEVGSFCGRSSYVIARSLPHRGFLWCIDPWMYPSTESGIAFGPDQFKAVHGIDTPKLRFDLNMADFEDSYDAIVGTSPEAAKDVANNLELVFLDGNHGEMSVMRDLLAWFPKLRKGGILCGHDYDNPGFPGVALAVDRFAAEHRITPWRGGGWMFYMVKP